MIVTGHRFVWSILTIASRIKMHSYLDLVVVCTFLVASLLMNLAKFIPAIAISISGSLLSNVCSSLTWNIVQTAIFGSNALYVCVYLLYLLTVPHDSFKGIHLSKVIALIGIPGIVIDALIASFVLPGCLYGKPALAITSYITGIAYGSLSTISYVGIGCYSIFRWHRGM